MRFSSSVPLVLSLALAASAAATAQAPRHDPRPAVTCRDGSRSVVSGRSACAEHGGVPSTPHARRVEKHAKSKVAKVEVKQEGKRRVKPEPKVAAKSAKAHAKRSKGKEKETPRLHAKAHGQPHAKAYARKDHRPRQTEHPSKRPAPERPGDDRQARARVATRAAAHRTSDSARSSELRPRTRARSEIRIATMAAHFRCKDGSVSDGSTPAAACAAHGGAGQ